MKGTQLIPSSTEEDSRSISVEPGGTELASTMQVSLAKRIIQPGTNRVVCLAAQTTVPMEEDDIASVSDLALRLSDGTNVKVSMSFFNDVALGGAFPEATARRVYDPDWYDNHRAPDSSNRLWLVFAAFLAVAFGSFCYFLPGGIDKLAAEIVARMPHMAAPIIMQASPSRTAAPPSAQQIQPTANVTTSSRKAKRTNKVAKDQPNKSSRRSSGKTKDGSIKVSRSSSFTGKSMLIPPPPPTAFAIPISQMAMYNMPPYAMPGAPAETPVKSAVYKPKAKPSKPLSLEIPKEQMTTTELTVPQAKIQNTSKPSVSSAVGTLLPEPARAYSRPRSSSSSYIERVDRTSTTSGAHSQSAPLPGGGSTSSEQPQLERIDLLN